MENPKSSVTSFYFMEGVALEIITLISDCWT